MSTVRCSCPFDETQLSAIKTKQQETKQLILLCPIHWPDKAQILGMNLLHQSITPLVQLLFDLRRQRL